MDPATIIGLTGAIFGIIDVTVRTITTLRRFNQLGKIKDLRILSLVSQLTALRAALDKIGEWISSDLAHKPQHYQLVIDLEECAQCCWVLVDFVELRTAEAVKQYQATQSPSTADGPTTSIKIPDLTEVQNCIQQETQALGLLLTACNCVSISEQQTLLHRAQSREILDAANDASSSLIVLCDASSMRTRATKWSETSSTMSTVFAFDATLTGSNVYRKAVRGAFRRSPTAMNTKPQANDLDESLLVPDEYIVQYKPDTLHKSQAGGAMRSDSEAEADSWVAHWGVRAGYHVNQASKLQLNDERDDGSTIHETFPDIALDTDASPSSGEGVVESSQLVPYRYSPPLAFTNISKYHTAALDLPTALPLGIYSSSLKLSGDVMTHKGMFSPFRSVNPYYGG